MMGIAASSLPSRWAVKRLDFVATVKARLGWKGLTASEYVDDGYIFLSTPNIKGREIDFENVNYITAARYFESPEIMLRQGDVLLAKDGSTLGICSVVRTLPKPATVNGSIAVIRPKGDLDPVFLYWVFSTPEMQAVIRQFKDGMGVPHLFQSDLRKFRVIVPPLSEQRTVADFLDREAARIGELIAMNRRFIDVVNQRATSETVAILTGKTRRPCKLTALDWIGEIPVDWEVLPIGRIANLIETGPFGSQLHAEDYEPGGVPVINPAHLRNGCIVEDGNSAVSVDTSARLRRHQLAVGDLVLARRGEVGRCAVVTTREAGWICGTGSMKLRFNSPHDPCYFNLLMATPGTLEQLLLHSVGSTMPNINPTILSRLVVPVPPCHQQTQIVAEVTEIKRQSEDLRKKIAEAVERLGEYRSSLISAAVTGQIDVRTYRPQEAAAVCP